MKANDFATLFRDICGLAIKTRQYDWASEDGSMDVKKMAKPIVPLKWRRAWDFAVEVARALPFLPTPVPGADPEGFVWLTWERNGSRVALEYKPDALKWHKTTLIGDSTGLASDEVDFVKMLRATFEARP